MNATRTAMTMTAATMDRNVIRGGPPWKVG
jgi:hypothetical protein